ncbi:MAG: hypothetical protein FJY86_02145 [Candidatus Diapherotrites archaeon]|uniref:Uncharacterized protein n=1 Tax=Candidatus Iainarchaeum sp. TaxID=3101447 RepID=A0A8T4C855_9ARCH|nr:hypothetical protein [Candidatus Diapherotrites archaeon]
MVKKWAFGKSRSVSTSPAFAVKRLFCKPFHAALVLIGLVLIFSAAQMHAFSPIPVSLSTSELFMQPGSELPVVVRVDTPLGKSALVSFSLDYPSSVLRVDGELNRISTSFPLSRDFQIASQWNAPQGKYAVTLRTHITIENQTFTDTQTILVHVGKKGLVTYLTSANSTLSPQISNVVFSTENIRLSRNENASISVSFVNNGSATDYLIRLSEPSLFLPVHISNDTHRFVESGERITSYIEIKTTPTTVFGKTPLRIEAYNLVSGEKTFLGTILVDVFKTTNVSASIPFHSFVVEQNGEISSSITLTNTEYSDTEVILESSSSLVEIPLRQTIIPAKSSLSVPVIIHASPSLSVRSDSIFILNPEITEQVSFAVETVKQGTLNPIPPSSPADQNSSIPSPAAISGFVIGAFSSWLGFVLIILAGLFLFSKRFRENIANRLPKTIPPANKKENVPSKNDNVSAQDTTTIVAAEPPSESKK